jgi:hypothetical protein
VITLPVAGLQALGDDQVEGLTQRLGGRVTEETVDLIVEGIFH